MKPTGLVALAGLAALSWQGHVRAQTVEYIHTDALGDAIAITNASGAVVELSEYEPFGRQLRRRSPGKQSAHGSSPKLAMWETAAGVEELAPLRMTGREACGDV